MTPEFLLEETKAEIRRLMSNMASLAERTEDAEKHMTYSYVVNELKSIINKMSETKPVES